MVEKQSRQAYRFGSYLLEPAEHKLTRKDREIHLRPKSYEVLVYLIQNRRHLVTKESMLEALWPDAYVGESTLKTCIWEIREALDDGNGETRYIKTLPKIGYQFVGNVEETGGDDAESTSRLRISIVIALSFSLLALVLWSAGFLLPEGPTDQRRLESIAILPFTSLDEEDDCASLCEGIPGLVSSMLSRLTHLRIKPTSVLSRYADENIDPARVCTEQGVDAVLRGTVEKRRNELTITVELFDGIDNSLVWGDAYHRGTENIHAVQDDIARQVAAALRQQLTPIGSDHLARGGTESPEAYQAYLKGRLHFDRWVFTEDHAIVFANAIRYFTKAIQIDPEFQAAYSMLSRVYFDRARTVTLSDQDYAKARSSLERLIEADDSTVLAHKAKAQILWQYERNWGDAETHYGLARERDPSYQTGTWFLEWMGRREEVIARLESDLEAVDPLSTMQQLSIGYLLLANGHFDRAIQQGKKALALEPQSADAWAILNAAYQHLGKHEEAFHAFVQTQELLGSAPEKIAALNNIFEESGLQGIWRYHLDHNQQEYPYHRPDLIACSYTKLGEIDKAFEWLARAWALPLWGSENSPSSWVWDPIRSDPRFEQLLREQNLPEEAIQRHLQIRN